MFFARISGVLCATMLVGLGSAVAQEPPPSPTETRATIAHLEERVKAQDARLNELEAQISKLLASQSSKTTPDSATAPAEAAAAQPTTQAEAAPAPVMQAMTEPMDHMSMGGAGPNLKIRGFFDFNFGAGSIANPLVFPIINNGCGTCGNPATPPHAGFQAGEFDLLFTSRLSSRINFLGEVVLGPDTTNKFTPDIERYALVYKLNPYFTIGGGRFHTSMGYYNTAYHHGNWFSTAEGRPIMYLFEDSGGVLPVHMVGLNLNGAVPNTEKLGLHWVAEVGNGLASNPFATEAVQNFYSDSNYKATNLAAYVRPQSLSGLQIGASWYHDILDPSQAQNPIPIPNVAQNIESAYVVYLSSDWEFLNEGVMLSNHVTGTKNTYRSPMSYIQVARKFGIYKPYFRYQYVRDNVRDPINLLKGTYYGPSVGLRIDFTEYAAFKLQYNHLYESSQLPGNGFNTQVAFTF